MCKDADLHCMSEKLKQRLDDCLSAQAFYLCMGFYDKRIACGECTAKLKPT